jgi:CcmD family protein
MPENFWWVFASYSIVWLAVILYVARLFGRQHQLERDLRRLEDEQRR